MGNLFAELKRRHIYRVAAAYAVVAWVLLQIVNNVIPIMQAPAWVGQFCLLLLVLGFPLAIFFAWMREIPSAETHPARATITDLGLIGVLIAVLAAVSYQHVIQTRPAAQTSSLEAARAAAASPAGAIAVAVMPFTNLSSDKEQEFFSDGMTEEIVTALAKIPDLRVVARESAFQYKGAKNDMRAIGQALGATHLIEGSVRKAGDRVRIAAQLVKADDGVNVWANSYDRQLTDVFAVQEDIARAIATSLRMPLGLKPGENLVNNRGIDPEFYEKYLRAKALYAGRGDGLPNVAQAGELSQEIVAKYPDYAPAWVTLSGVYYVSGLDIAGDVNKPIAEARAQANEFRTKADAAVQKAIQLDPNIAQAYTRLAVLAWSRGKAPEADELVAKALALDPTGELGHVGEWLAIAGRSKDALVHLEKAFALEPFPPPGGSLVVVNARWVSGQNDAAIALAKTLRPTDRAPALARIYASMGRYGEAADALTEIASDPNSVAAEAARLLRTAPAKTATPDRLPRLPQNLQFVYLHIGAPDRAIAAYERQAEIGYLTVRGQPQYVWHPSYAPVRQTERFKALMKKVGLVEYWRAKGWPEQCHPTTGDDFACD